MQSALFIFRQGRRNMIQLLNSHTLEQVNIIPPGFNNNLIWNAGHTLVAQQYIMYLLSDQPPLIPIEEFSAKYGPDTFPDQQATAAELEQIKRLLEETAAQTEADYTNGRFERYRPFESEYYSLRLQHIDEGLAFVLMHEGNHFGYMKAIQLALSKIG